MAHGGDLNTDGKQWIMPILLEAFGWAVAFKSVDAFYDHRPWLGYGTVAVVLIVSGVVWIAFRKRIENLWDKLRKKETLKAKEVVLQKPKHNVQFVGFNLVTESLFTAARFNFRNVPNGNLLGKFEKPRLSVAYYKSSTGEELDSFYALHWYDEGEEKSDIDATGRSVTVAMFTDKWIVGGEDNPASWKFVRDDDKPIDVQRSIDLPFGELRIVAKLFGGYVDSPVLTITGVLTLGSDGSASFSKYV